MADAHDDAPDTFTRTRLAWLEAIQDDRTIAPATFTVAFAINRRFNRETFDKTGECVAWPGRQEVGELTGQKLRQITAHIQSLRDAGYLTVKRRFNGASRYGLSLPNERKTAECDVRKTADYMSGKPPITKCGKPPTNSLNKNSLKEHSDGETRARRARTHALPDDWNPPEDAYDLGAEIGLTSAEIENETAAFRDHAKANDRRQADWTAAWRQWVRKAATWKAERKPNSPQGARHGFSGMDYALERLG